MPSEYHKQIIDGMSEEDAKEMLKRLAQTPGAAAAVEDMLWRLRPPPPEWVTGAVMLEKDLLEGFLFPALLSYGCHSARLVCKAWCSAWKHVCLLQQRREDSLRRRIPRPTLRNVYAPMRTTFATLEGERWDVTSVTQHGEHSFYVACVRDGDLSIRHYCNADHHPSASQQSSGGVVLKSTMTVREDFPPEDYVHSKVSYCIVSHGKHIPDGKHMVCMVSATEFDFYGDEAINWVLVVDLASDSVAEMRERTRIRLPGTSEDYCGLALLPPENGCIDDAEVCTVPFFGESIVHVFSLRGTPTRVIGEPVVPTRVIGEPVSFPRKFDSHHSSSMGLLFHGILAFHNGVLFVVEGEEGRMYPCRITALRCDTGEKMQVWKAAPPLKSHGVRVMICNMVAKGDSILLWMMNEDDGITSSVILA